MIRVQAHARLHFGLLSPAVVDSWPNIDGDEVVPARRFGGVGLMIEEPRLVLRAEPAREWSATGTMAERALEMVERVCDAHCPPQPSPLALTIETAVPEHAGFGSGTQLGMAVAKVIAVAAGHADWGAVDLARRVGRGLRSGIGVYGFEHGGLIVEAGKRADEPVAPLIAREIPPEAWRIVVVLPESTPGIHGGPERAAFEELAVQPDATDSLCRLVLLGMLPALREKDCRAFGEALYDFNSRVGELFAAAQGGRYANSLCSEIIRFLRGIGVAGVGQSSWGPGLFAIVEDAARAEDVARRIRQRFSTRGIWVTRPAGPAVVTTA